MYFLIVLFPRLLGWSENIFFSFRENLTQDITRDKHQWTNKYKKTEKKRKKWRLCSGSSTKTSESNIRNFTNNIIKQLVFHSDDKVTGCDVSINLILIVILSILGNNVDQEEYQSYKDSFDAFDWNNSGREGCLFCLFSNPFWVPILYFWLFEGKKIVLTNVFSTLTPSL